MKTLVRLPNWLGDMVMSVGAIHQLSSIYPDAEISVIVKKGLHELLPYFPSTKHQFVFSKEEYKGFKGLWKFGRKIKATDSFDSFISFPDSFSSALMGFASGAKKRIGYKKEGRDFLLTQAFQKPKGLHRVEEYVQLLQPDAGGKTDAIRVFLHHQFPREDYIVVNINSEASSRRLTTTKAIELINAVRKNFTQQIKLIGGPGERAFVEDVFHKLNVKEGIESLAGKTSLHELVKILASAQLMLTTDSGPAHLANALGTQTVVLFGAGNENNTAPFNQDKAQVIRLGKLSCEPCTKNVCIQFGTPQCLELLEVHTIVEAMKQSMQYDY